MGKDERRGARYDRRQRIQTRVPELGYYFVVTDAKETEVNYLYGLRDSIPSELRDKLVVKVITAPTSELLERSLELAAIEPQYRIPWIVFDRDKVNNFDQIIADSGRHDVYVGWSNPCIEVWFHAYFDGMQSMMYPQSVPASSPLFFRDELSRSTKRTTKVSTGNSAHLAMKIRQQESQKPDTGNSNYAIQDHRICRLRLRYIC